MAREFDTVVIGSGSAGTSAAMALRRRGQRVAIVDSRPFGGTCALRGCDPKKVFVAAARAADDAQRYCALGILRAPVLHWPELARFKRTFTDPVSQQRREEYEKAGIVALRGDARFTGPEALRAGDELLHAKHFVVASGAAPVRVAKGDDALLTSDGFLDLEELPTSLLFVGGGYIAFEFAHIAARAGVRVAILHKDAMPLRGFDGEAVAKLVELTRSVGIAVHLGTAVESVARDASGIVVSALVNGSKREFRAAAGVLAAGRAADVDGLALETGAVDRTKRGVKVDAHLQSTSNPRVYAAGDAVDDGGLPLTPVAGLQGEIVAENILDGNTRTLDARGLASMVYTIPSLGSVGISEKQARERGIEIDVRSGDMTGWYSTRHVAGRAAFYKVVLERSSRKILGATILGPHAEEQINVLALAIRNELGVGALAETLFAYPTGSSDMEYILTG